VDNQAIHTVATEWTRFHEPNPEMVQGVSEIRAAAYIFIYAILKNCPPGTERDHAILKARSAMLFANTSIIVPKVTI